MRLKDENINKILTYKFLVNACWDPTTVTDLLNRRNDKKEKGQSKKKWQLCNKVQ